MSKKFKHKIALFLLLTITVCSSINTTVLAAEPTNISSTENQIVITNLEITPDKGLSRMAKGYNYTYSVRNSGNNNELIADVSGTVIFDINNGQVRVQNAGTPKVTVYNTRFKVTATPSSSGAGTSAYVNIKIVATQYLIFHNEVNLKIKCDSGGTIWLE